MDDVEDGFTSQDFNLGENILEGDTRSGLDEAAKREVKRIMKKHNVGFDEARKLFTERSFAKHNIGPEVSFAPSKTLIQRLIHIGTSEGSQVCFLLVSEFNLPVTSNMLAAGVRIRIFR